VDPSFARPDQWLMYATYTGAFVFPIGALVMRRHFVDATGGLLVVKIALYSLAWLSAPLALLTALRVFTDLGRSLAIVWQLLRWF
jgi:hypothetical protein